MLFELYFKYLSLHAYNMIVYDNGPNDFEMYNKLAQEMQKNV